MSHRDFRAGPWQVKNPLANAEDVGLISGPERSYILWGQLSMCTTTTEACVS